jgi:hypothetical protein
MATIEAIHEAIHERSSVTMATREQLRKMITAQPFRPYLVKLASGRVYRIEHPENAGCDDRGRSMFIFQGRSLHEIEMLLVEELVPVEPEQPAPGDHPDANGSVPPPAVEPGS